MRDSHSHPTVTFHSSGPRPQGRGHHFPELTARGIQSRSQLLSFSDSKRSEKVTSRLSQKEGRILTRRLSKRAGRILTIPTQKGGMYSHYRRLQKSRPSHAPNQTFQPSRFSKKRDDPTAQKVTTNRLPNESEKPPPQRHFSRIPISKKRDTQFTQKSLPFSSKKEKQTPTPKSLLTGFSSTPKGEKSLPVFDPVTSPG